MHYKAKTIAALQMILDGWPDETPDEVDPDNRPVREDGRRTSPLDGLA